MLLPIRAPALLESRWKPEWLTSLGWGTEVSQWLLIQVLNCGSWIRMRHLLPANSAIEHDDIVSTVSVLSLQAVTSCQW